ncbi:MAG: hypothetical protein ABSC95_21355 [Acetobacteraceae bacterium]|jgi:hypothetical protein
MTPAKTVAVKRDDLEWAFEFVSSGAPSDNTASISVATGKIHWHSASLGMADDEDPDGPDADDGDDDADGSIAVPHKNDLQLGRRLVLRFVGQEMPRDYDTVADFFRRRGAYARFKGLLQRRHMLERWYEFENRATQQALLAWCEENGIQLVDEPPAGGV